MSSDAPYLLPLPRDWNRHIQSAILRIISLAQFVIVCARGRTANSSSAAVRLAAEKDQLEQEVALLREELRIKDARFKRVPSQRRPPYTPIQRMAILELHAARGWTLTQTAQAFLVAPDTISAWMKRLDRDLVRYLVQRLKVLCLSLGTVKLVKILCRAGLQIRPAPVSAFPPTSFSLLEGRHSHPRFTIRRASVPGRGFW